MHGYCLKCREKREFKDVQVVTLKKRPRRPPGHMRRLRDHDHRHGRRQDRQGLASGTPPSYRPARNRDRSTRPCQGSDRGSDGGPVRACDTTPGVFPAYFPPQIRSSPPYNCRCRVNSAHACPPSRRLRSPHAHATRACVTLPPATTSATRRFAASCIGQHCTKRRRAGHQWRSATPEGKSAGTPYYVTVPSPPSSPPRAQQSNTDQQMSFRSRWSSRTSSRIAAGSWCRCHRHSRSPELSRSPAAAPNSCAATCAPTPPARRRRRHTAPPRGDAAPRPSRGHRPLVPGSW